MLQRLKIEPLLKCSVLHALDGRIRIGCRAIKYLADHTGEISERFSQIAGVTDVTVSTITANILIYYDTERVDQADLIEAFETNLAPYSFYAHRAEMEQHHQRCTRRDPLR